MRFILFLSLFCIITLGSAQDSLDAKIDTLFDLMRSKEVYQQSLKQILAQIRTQPNLPEDFFERLEKKLTDSAYNEIIIFSKNKYKSIFSASEIDALIAFYPTPIGQRLIQHQRELYQSIMEYTYTLGQHYGQTAYAEMIAQNQRERQEAFEQIHEPCKPQGYFITHGMVPLGGYNHFWQGNKVTTKTESGSTIVYETIWRSQSHFILKPVSTTSKSIDIRSLPIVEGNITEGCNEFGFEFIFRYNDQYSYDIMEASDKEAYKANLPIPPLQSN